MKPILLLLGILLSCSAINAQTSSSIKAAPNPFIDSTLISFNLPHNDTVTIKISDLTGKTVSAPFTNVPFNYGQHSFYLNATSLPDGIYLMRMTLSVDTTRTIRILKSAPTGINEYSTLINTITYPNPTISRLYLGESSLNTIKVHIYSVDGKLLKVCSVDHDHSIDLRNIPGGQLLVIGYSEDKRITFRHKIIKSDNQ